MDIGERRMFNLCESQSLGETLHRGRRILSLRYCTKANKGLVIIRIFFFGGIINDGGERALSLIASILSRGKTPWRKEILSRSRFQLTTQVNENFCSKQRLSLMTRHRPTTTLLLLYASLPYNRRGAPIPFLVSSSKPDPSLLLDRR